MVSLLEKLRKEWAMIKAAPWSFFIVCVVATATIGGGLQWLYHDKLNEAERRVGQWKSESDYWKELAERKKADPIDVREITPKPVYLQGRNDYVCPIGWTPAGGWGKN